MRNLSEKNLAELSAGIEKGTPVDKIVLTPGPAKNKRNNEEWELQRDVFKWWRSHASDFGVDPRLYFSIPNGAVLGSGKERIIRGKMLKLAGAENGIPDTLLAVPRGGFLSMFIELKAANGVLSDAQKSIHPMLYRMGFQVKVCWSLFGAQETISNYLNQTPL